MPGHKGRGILGCESLDITEIRGADDLYHPEGILARSEENASRLFGCRTVYSAEGSSLAIRAMLYLAYTRSGCKGRCLAGRNAHKSFLHTAVLLDFPISWLWAGDSYLSCPVTAETVEAAILEEKEKPFAVYLTSPDYLGNLAPVGEIASVCHRHGVPLLVDNAHGAYLKFLPRSLHPMDLGADLCCDSAHKTLPVLTGGAYLHMTSDYTAEDAKAAMALFGSTSPSWLILQSLDGANPLLERLPGDIAALAPHIAALKGALLAHGFALVGAEPLKITVHAAKFGYSGEEMEEILGRQGIFCEFADRDFLVFMLTPRNTPEELDRLRAVLCLCVFVSLAQDGLEHFSVHLRVVNDQDFLSVHSRSTAAGSLSLPLSDFVGFSLFYYTTKAMQNKGKFPASATNIIVQPGGIVYTE